MDTVSVVTLAISVFSVLANGILLIILYQDPLKKFRTTTSYLIISLTFSDFATGAVGCAFILAPSHAATFAIFWATVLSSFFTIFFMSCERLVVVTYPLKARNLITKGMVFLFIAANWLVSSVLGGLMGSFSMPQIDHLEFTLFCTILILVLVLVVIYFMIIWRTKHKPKFLRESIQSRSMHLIRREKRLTGVLFLLVAVLMVTVVPYLVGMAAFAGYRIFFGSGNYTHGFIVFATYYFPVELLNFAVNPIIYAWRLPNYRKSLYFYLAKLPFGSKKFVMAGPRESFYSDNTNMIDKNAEK